MAGDAVEVLGRPDRDDVVMRFTYPHISFWVSPEQAFRIAQELRAAAEECVEARRRRERRGTTS